VLHQVNKPIVKNRSFPVVFSKKAGLSASLCQQICRQKLGLPARVLARCLVLLFIVGLPSSTSKRRGFFKLYFNLATAKMAAIRRKYGPQCVKTKS
jgi:hypothetical protein